MEPVSIRNQEVRRALIALNGLAGITQAAPRPLPPATPVRDWVAGAVRSLGFVQVDSVSAVERAHHQILFRRNPRYRQEHLRQCLEERRDLFEGWTHDAAILPVETFPYWRHYFERTRRFEIHPGYRRYFSPVTEQDIDGMLGRIERDGPLGPRDVAGPKADYQDDYFAKPTIAKITLEWLWRTGRLAVAHRRGREKVYDLAERVIPEEHFRRKVARAEYVAWACRAALERLGTATPAQIARFADAISQEQAADWCRRNLGREIRTVRTTYADGSSGNASFALETFLDRLGRFPAPPRALRLLSPFDPLIHDRQRTRRLFGFDYTIEIWVPARKRRYGYYVLPILEGTRFTGRIDLKADRSAGRLVVQGLWWEEGITATARRRRQLERGLERLARFCGTPAVEGPR